MAVRRRINEAMYGVALSQRIRRSLGAEAAAKWARVAPTGYGGTASMPKLSRFRQRLQESQQAVAPSAPALRGPLGPGGAGPGQPPAPQAGLPPGATGVTQAQFKRERGEARRLAGLAQQVAEGKRPRMRPWERNEVEEILEEYGQSIEGPQLSPEEQRKQQQSEFYDQFQETMSEAREFDNLESYLDFAQTIMPQNATPETIRYADKVIEEYMPKKLREEKQRMEEEEAYEYRRGRAVQEDERTEEQYGKSGVYYDDRARRMVHEAPRVDPEVEQAQIIKNKNKLAVKEIEAKPDPENWAIVDMSPRVGAKYYDPQVVQRDIIGGAITRGGQITGFHEEVDIPNWTSPYQRTLERESKATKRPPDQTVIVHVPGHVPAYGVTSRDRAEEILRQVKGARIMEQRVAAGGTEMDVGAATAPLPTRGPGG